MTWPYNIIHNGTRDEIKCTFFFNKHVDLKDPHSGSASAAMTVTMTMKSPPPPPGGAAEASAAGGFSSVMFFVPSQVFELSVRSEAEFPVEDQGREGLLLASLLPVMHLGAVRTAQYVRVVPKMDSCKLHSSWQTHCLPIASSSVVHIVSVAHQLRAEGAHHVPSIRAAKGRFLLV